MLIGIDATALPPKPVGAGTYIINLIRTLANTECGHEFVIFAHQSGRLLLETPQTTKFRWVTIADKSPAKRLIWEQAVFPWIARREGIDLLHSLHYTRPLFLPCASVVTFHDMTFFLFPHLHTRSKRIFFPAAIRMSARTAGALIADSESTRQDAIRVLGISPDRITAVPLAAAEDYRPITDQGLLDRARQKYGLPENFILYVGLVEPRKNLPALIRSYKGMVDKGVTHHLVVVGRRGWMYEQVFQQVEALGISERVHFTGYADREDLPVIYNLASVFVYPTLYEGFGLPVLEAMRCGAPVVTSNVSSLPEIVGEGGLMVAPGDEAALTGAVLRLLDEPGLREKLSAQGLKQSALFSWERVAYETVQVYEKALRGK
ncbi:MAG: glycosyltransferase family 1 protein [Chloroflexota bacterium]|nr:MAG: glycosyltransferase family 1 protein [Chloroflexota bacterium]